jgi:nicotinamidase-related amidase
MMKAFFFLDLDTQRDLISADGSMPVPGGERMIPKLRRLFEFARANAVTVISTAITQDGGDPGLLGHRDLCVRGTQGQRKIDDTLMLHPLVLENRQVDRNFADLVRKHQQIVLEKSGFDVFVIPAFEKLLRVLPQRAIVFGVPLEHSIRHAALGLRRMGLKTVVLQNAALPLEPREAAKAESAMRGAGVEFITLEVLLGALTEV